MDKYRPLGDHLTSLLPKRSVFLTFPQIESAIQDVLPASATRHYAFWAQANNVARQLGRCGWRAFARFDQGGVSFTYEANHEAAPGREAARKRPARLAIARPRDAETVRKLSQLVERFASYVDRSAGYFSGPSSFFHEETMRRRRKAPLSALVNDRDFVVVLYATLTSWGMHRMGPTAVKLIEFDEFQTNIKRALPLLERMEHERLERIQPQQLEQVTAEAWKAIQTLAPSRSSSQLVAGSKALHHLLPDMTPPIDREYTLRFFFGRTSIRSNGWTDFREVLRLFTQIAQECQGLIIPLVESTGFNSSLPKVIDNALIGFGLTEKAKREALEPGP